MTTVPQLADPSGPPDTRPPGGPTNPPPPSGPNKLADALDAITLLLRVAQLVADRDLSGADPADLVRLDYALGLARLVVADLQTPARRDPSSSSAGEIATPGGPVQAPHVAEKLRRSARAEVGAAAAADRVGGPPAPGTDFPECGEKWCCYERRRAGDRCPTGSSFSPPPTPALRPFPSRTPPFEFGVGQALYDVLPGRSS